MHENIDKILFSEQQIQAGIARVSAAITDKYRDGNFTVVIILKGACVFAADLIRNIPLMLELVFVSAASYRNDTRPGALKIDFFPAAKEIEGRRLLLVDDILDSGRTISALRREFLHRGAAEVSSCVLLDKPSRRVVDYRPDFHCFEVGDHFVVGYGMDHAGGYRNLPFVTTLKSGK